MKTRAAIHINLGEYPIVDEVEVPDPKPDQALVKLFSSGICHSQLHNIFNTEFTRPTTLGHEGTGVVAAVGRDVSHVKEGDHVIVTWVPRNPVLGSPPRVPTGVTYREQVMPPNVFTWGEHTLVNGQLLVPISKDEPTDVSCIVGCAVLTGAGAVMNTAQVRPGDSVAIFGVGGVGLSAVAAAAMLEAYPIIAVDLQDDKLEFAKEFGATHTVNASTTDPVQAVLDLTGGGAEYAFDTIGVRTTAEQILPSVRIGGNGAENHGGMAVMVGYPPDEITINPKLLMMGQRRFRGSLGATYPEKDFATFLRWNREGKLPLEKLVTRRYALDDIAEACDDLHHGRIFGRAILEF